MLKSEAENTRGYPNRAARAGSIRVKVRFDYKGTPRPNRFFFGGKKSEEVAEEIREQKASLWKNVPIQGVRVEEVQAYDLYKIAEGEEEELITYAPLELILTVDSLEDCVYLIAREEFRTVEILEPETITLSSLDMEKLFYRFSENCKAFKGS